MKAIAAIHPGHGHLNLMLPIAKALRAAQHEVLFACAPLFEPTVAKHGFATAAAGYDWLESDTAHYFPEIEEVTPDEALYWHLTNIFSDLGAIEMSYDLLDLCETFQPDFILRDVYEFGASVTSEKLALPQISVASGCYVDPAVLRMLIHEQLSYLRQIHDMPVQPPLEMLSRGMYVTNMLPQFENQSLQLPSNHAAYRVTLPPLGQPPGWADRLLTHRPTVHVTLGTVFSERSDVYDLLIEGLRDEPINLVVAIGRKLALDRFGTQPDNVIIVPFAPHDWLLPQTDVLIQHGGASTTLRALQLGIQQIVVPLGADQPQHAARCAMAGNGRILLVDPALAFQLEGAPYELLTPESARTAVRTMLAEPHYLERATQLKEAYANLPTTNQLVETIEQFVQARMPKQGAALAPMLSAL